MVIDPRMRFAVLGIWHETNTFSSVPADYGHFERSGIFLGEEIVRNLGESYTERA